MEPVVILAMPRSGSSMTAGIFHLHGVWAGNCIPADRLNPKGYFENTDVKNILIRRCGKLAQGTTPAEPQSGLRNEILGLNPDNPWMFKCSAMYRKAFNEFSPKFVCVRRRTEGVICSNMDVGFLGTKDERRMLEIIDAHHREMDASNGVNVYTDDLVSGDYSSIESALEYCGLKPVREKIEKFVDPSLWNRSSS